MLRSMRLAPSTVAPAGNDWIRSKRLVKSAFDAGAVDLVVTAYRGNPDLLAALLDVSRPRESETMYIVARAAG